MTALDILNSKYLHMYDLQCLMIIKNIGSRYKVGMK
jgi:hypothetical protein